MITRPPLFLRVVIKTDQNGSGSRIRRFFGMVAIVGLVLAGPSRVCEAQKRTRSKASQTNKKKALTRVATHQGELNASLLKAIRAGDTSLAEKLIGNGASANSRVDKDVSALVLAIITTPSNAPESISTKPGNAEMVSLLIEHKARVNERNSKGSTPLAIASILGNPEVVQALLQGGAAINALSSEGITPLMLATMQQQTKVVSLLIEKKANVNIRANNGMTALTYSIMPNPKSEADSVMTGPDDMFDELISHGADVHNEGGMTPLMAAAYAGDYEKAVTLVDKRVKIDPLGLRGATPLSFALLAGNARVAILLLDHGANINHSMSNGQTMLMIAVKAGNYVMVEQLLKRGVKSEARDQNGMSALSLANERKMSAIVSLLKKSGLKE